MPEKQLNKKFLKNLALLPIRFYRMAISPLTPPSCRFHPTCSSYALEAIEKHGVVKGVFLAARRLIKCHPGSHKNPLDPVPEAFAWGDVIRYKRGWRKAENKAFKDIK